MRPIKFGKTEVQEARALITLCRNGMYVEKVVISGPCTELIDCFTAKDAKYSMNYLPGIGVKVTPEFARMYVENGKETTNMNDAQRTLFQSHEKRMADLQTLEKDIIKEHTDASYWYQTHFDRVKLNERHNMCAIILGQVELSKMHYLDAFCKLRSIMRSYTGQTEWFLRPK